MQISLDIIVEEIQFHLLIEPYLAKKILKCLMSLLTADWEFEWVG